MVEVLLHFERDCLNPETTKSAFYRLHGICSRHRINLGHMINNSPTTIIMGRGSLGNVSVEVGVIGHCSKRGVVKKIYANLEFHTATDPTRLVNSFQDFIGTSVEVYGFEYV